MVDMLGSMIVEGRAVVLVIGVEVGVAFEIEVEVVEMGMVNSDILVSGFCCVMIGEWTRSMVFAKQMSSVVFGKDVAGYLELC